MISDNEPYTVTDASDYTIPIHGEQRGLHHIANEVRQDLIIGTAGQRAWISLLARLPYARTKNWWQPKSAEMLPLSLRESSLRNHRNGSTKKSSCRPPVS
jgi:hypothetical protein